MCDKLIPDSFNFQNGISLEFLSKLDDQLGEVKAIKDNTVNLKIVDDYDGVLKNAGWNL
jgi:hypothetical protein